MGVTFVQKGSRWRPFAQRAEWSYGGFGIFRERLALAVGVDLRAMEGFGGTKPWGVYLADPRAAPLVPLLDHSDCDGDLSPEECARVAPALRAAVAPWPDEYDRQQALKLAAQMEAAAAAGRRLEFH